MKILVFTTFFSRDAFYYFTTNKTGQISKKKDLFSEVATTIVVFLQATLQGHYMYALNNSFFDPIGIKSTLPGLSTFLS